MRLMILVSVNQSVMRAGCAKSAEWIDVLFGVETPGHPRNILLDGVPIPHGEGGVRCGRCQGTLATCRLLRGVVAYSVRPRIRDREFSARVSAGYRCVVTLGKLFTPMPCLCNQAVCMVSRGLNRHTTRCTSPLSVVSQCKLLSG